MSQVASDFARQVTLLLTVIVFVSLFLSKGKSVGLISIWGAWPRWYNESSIGATSFALLVIVILPLLLDVVVFLTAVTVILPLPLPLVGLTLIQSPVLLTVQSTFELKLIVLVPPFASNAASTSGLSVRNGPVCPLRLWRYASFSTVSSLVVIPLALTYLVTFPQITTSSPTLSWTPDEYFLLLKYNARYI